MILSDKQDIVWTLKKYAQYDRIGYGTDIIKHIHYMQNMIGYCTLRKNMFQYKHYESYAKYDRILYSRIKQAIVQTLQNICKIKQDMILSD